MKNSARLILFQLILVMLLIVCTGGMAAGSEPVKILAEEDSWQLYINGKPMSEVTDVTDGDKVTMAVQWHIVNNWPARDLREKNDPVYELDLPLQNVVLDLEAMRAGGIETTDVPLEINGVRLGRYSILVEDGPGGGGTSDSKAAGNP
ncbi:MAG: hypothetical protein IJ083_10355 [Clostridia bacterium]|nr:hypothetical protein [Clostridia bacterium]